MIFTKKYKFTFEERQLIIRGLKKLIEIENQEIDNLTVLFNDTKLFPTLAQPLFDFFRNEIIKKRQEKFNNLIERIRN